MDPRRRMPRLFLDHKPPLVAFTVVALACALMMVHVARSEAAPGWLRAGLGGVVAQRVVEATVLEPDPVRERTTEAAGPLTQSTEGSEPTPSAGPDSTGAASPDGSAGDGPRGQVAGAQVGVVHPGSDPADPSDSTDDAADGAADGSDAVGSSGPGKGQGKGEGRDDQPVSDVPVPGTPVHDVSQGPDPRDHHDWPGEWFGGHGHHGDDDGEPGDDGRGDDADSDDSDDSDDNRDGRGHGHGDHGSHDDGEHGHSGHGGHGHR